MANSAKIRALLKNCRTQFEEGQTVSVDRSFFDDISAPVNDRYSSFLSAGVTRLYGTVKFKLLRKARVQFHCDNTTSDIEYEHLRLEKDALTDESEPNAILDDYMSRPNADEQATDIVETESIPRKRLRVKLPPRFQKKTAQISTSEVSTSGSIDSDEEMHELDLSSSSSDEPEESRPIGSSSTASRNAAEQQKQIWCSSGWRMDPRQSGFWAFGPRLNIFPRDVQTLSDLDFLFAFLPLDYIKNEIVPATNKTGFNLTFEEFVVALGILYSMEVLQLPERRMYWRTESDGFLVAPQYGKYMPLARFESILRNLQFSMAENKDDQISKFLDAVNANLKAVITAGDVLCVDESMVKSYHKNLKGKIKIIRKPRPIGNEMKTLCDAQPKIILHMELHEDIEIMKNKKYVEKYGATTACTLRLTESWTGSGRLVVGDSWFGSVKCVGALMRERGLYAIMLVKTAHKEYPRQLLGEFTLVRGQWVSVSGTLNHVPMMATRYIDLKQKDFISSCSTTLAGCPRITKYCGDIPRPQVAEEYLQFAAGIDIHNHVRTGSCGLEDVWATHSYILRQFGAIAGFMLTNAYLAMSYFRQNQRDHSNTEYVSGQHTKFKISLANQMLSFSEKMTPFRPGA